MSHFFGLAHLGLINGVVDNGRAAVVVVVVTGDSGAATGGIPPLGNKSDGGGKMGGVKADA